MAIKPFQYADSSANNKPVTPVSTGGIKPFSYSKTPAPSVPMENLQSTPQTINLSKPQSEPVVVPAWQPKEKSFFDTAKDAIKKVSPFVSFLAFPKMTAVKNAVDTVDKGSQAVLDKTLNTEKGKEIGKIIEGATRGSSAFVATPKAFYKRTKDIVTGGGNGKDIVDYYAEEVNKWQGASQDQTNTLAENVARGVLDSGVQSAVGVLLNLVPFVGKGLSASYFTTISAQEQIQERGKVDSPLNIGIDVAGDMLLGNLVEGILKKPAEVLTKSGFKTLSNIGQGFLVEGTTEPAQTMLKYANDYRNAKTDEEKTAIIAKTKDYVKNGGMVLEFLVGGVSGGLISGAASGADGINTPKPTLGINEDKDKDFTAEQNNAREAFREDVKKNLEETGGNTIEVSKMVNQETGIPLDIASTLVDEVAENYQIENAPVASLDLAKLGQEAIAETQSPTVSEISPEALEKSIDDILSGKVAEEEVKKETPADTKENIQPKQAKEAPTGEVPTFETPEFNKDFDNNPVIFPTGTYVVGRGGTVREVVSGNDKFQKGDALYDQNIGSLRTRELGQKADYLDYANQVRPATEEEIAQAKEYEKNNPPKEEVVGDEKKKKGTIKKFKAKEEEVKKEEVSDFKEGDSVSFTRNGKTVTGIIRSVDEDSSMIEMDETFTVAGGVPIKNIGRISNKNLKKVESSVVDEFLKEEVKPVEKAKKSVKLRDLKSLGGIPVTNITNEEIVPIVDVEKISTEELDAFINKSGKKTEAFEAQALQNEFLQKINKIVPDQNEYKKFDELYKEYKPQIIDNIYREYFNRYGEYPIAFVGMSDSFFDYKHLEENNTFVLEFGQSERDDTEWNQYKDINEVIESLNSLKSRGKSSKIIQSDIQYQVDGIRTIDNANTIDTVDESGIIKGDDNNRQTGVPDTGDLSSTEDRGSGDSTPSQISGYDRATMLAQLGNGSVGNRTAELTKKQRQLINEEVESLLEVRDYSTNTEDYSEEDRLLMSAYTGAGGKESVGAEGAGLLNEYYTPPKVISKVWEIAKKLLPNAQTAFEPSVGVGRFIELSPVEVQVDGAEISKVSGTIASVLYPDSNITIGDFQELFFDKKTNKQKSVQQYDLVVGNPPFGDRAGFLKGKGEESDINREEEYFIKRGLDMVKEGGYLIYVVNSSFLKKGATAGKNAISQLGKLEVAYRLPEDSFEDTTIGTDIVVFKKNETIDPISVMSRNQTMRDDIYFRGVIGGNNVLGETLVRKNRFGQQETYVKGNLDEAIDKINANVLQSGEIMEDKETVTEQGETVAEEQIAVLEEDKKKTKTKASTPKKGVVYTQTTFPKKGAEKLVTPIQNISNKTNYSPVEVNMLKRIDRDLAIPNPTPAEMPFLNYAGGEYFNDGIYFSGEVYQKLTQLENDKSRIIAELGQEQYDKQKKGLEAIIPARISIKDIAFDPMDRHVTDIPTTVDRYGREESGTVLSAFTQYLRANDVALSPRVSKYDIITYVQGGNLSKGSKPIEGYIKSDAKRLFSQFLKNNLKPETQKVIEDTYNVEKNGYVQPDYTKIPVEIENMANQFRGRDFMLSQTQKNGVGFLVNKGSGLIAYGVGVGKTHTLAIATVANMQKGWSKRPLYVVPKSTIDKTWLATLNQMFPTLVINNLEGLQAPVIRRLIKEKGENKAEWIKDGELTIISHEGILRLGLNEEELRQATGDLKDALWTEPKTKRGGEKTKSVYDEIAGNAQKYVTDVMISDLGFDHVSVDEVHNFRKVFQGAKAEKVDSEGNSYGKKRYANVLGGTPSRRAQQLFLISQYIQKNNDNRNVFLASATPFENHATEVYNILSFVARDRMRAMGILNINDFFATFANFEVELDRKLNGEWVNREKMKSFANLPTLQGLLKEFIDYQEDPTLVRPDRRVITPHLQMSELQSANLVRIQNLLNGVKDQVEDTEGFDEESKAFFDVAMSTKEVDDGAFLKASTYSIANSVSPYFIKEYVKKVPSAEQLVEDSPKIKYAIETLKKVKADPKTADFGTFIFFGTMGVSYHPMIADYIAKEVGYKPEEVAVLSGNVTDDQKEDIKERFNDGRVKVLLGGDQTKEGIDLQNNGFITLNLALGWNPTQISQVEGRVWRQGNRRNIAPLIYPLVENSGDSTIYSKFEEKGGRINDLFSYKGKMFDVGEIDPAEKKLSLLTDPKDKAKMQIEIDKTATYNERLLLENDIKELKAMNSDKNQLTEDLAEFEQSLEKGVDRWGDAMSEDAKKEIKKEIKSIKGKLERLDARIEAKNISDINADINALEVKIVEVDAKIKDLDKTYEEKLAFFSEQYKKDIKNRKTMPQHMEEIQALIDEVQERTPEEIENIRAKKIADEEARKQASIPEFQKMKIDETLISFEEAKQRIQGYKDRLKLDFDVDFAHAIFTGGINKDGSKERAYAVTYNNKISLIDNVRKTTADHEMVHVVMNNLEKISAFEGITRTQLLKAMNGGKEYTDADLERLNEEIAINFEKKVQGAEQSNLPMVLRRFFERLEILLTKMLKALGKDVDVIQDFYRRLSSARGKEMVKLKSQELLDRQVQFNVKGKDILAFDEAREEYLRTTQVNFQKMIEDLKSYSVNLRRKDIDLFDQLFAQSRDLYLKDTTEFKQADELMKIGDERRMKKSLLDKKFAKMLEPYFNLKKDDKVKVNEVLVQGDIEVREYSDMELAGKGLSQAEIDAYNAVRKSFKVAHDLLLSEMEANGVPPEEIEQFRADRVGYLPHKWKYRFAIKKQVIKTGADPRDGDSWRTESMDVFKTAKLADKAFDELVKNNTTPDEVRYVNDTLDSLEVDFFSEQRFSFENMKSIIAKAKVDGEIKTEMLTGLRNMVKEKGFGRNFIKRTGIDGYEKKEIPEIIANYFAGLDGFITKMEAGKKYYGVLEKIDARRQKKFYEWSRNSIAYDMGHSKEGNAFKEAAYIFFLANDISFLLTNMTQNLTVGIGELSKLVSGTEKIYKAETTLMKSLSDWTLGKVTPEEKAVINGLVDLGRLGGEMTAELMGFKNNPVYAGVSSVLNKALYNSTAIVEKNVNRIPAFLAARRLLKEKGLSDKEANEQALSISDDIHFRYGKQHRPEFMRGRKSVVFVFNHYIRSFLYQLSRDLKNKEFTSVAKKLFYTTLLGGTAALPFAKLLKEVYKWLWEPEPDEEEEAELKSMELALERGLPASFLNIDLSNKVGIDVMLIANVLEELDTPKSVREKLGSVLVALTGAVGSLMADRIPKGFDLVKQGRYVEAGGKLLPDFVGNLLKAYNGATKGVLSQSGNALIDENGDRFRYTNYEAFIKATGYTPTREQLAWDEQSKQWELKNKNAEGNAEVKNKISKLVRDGKIEEARKYQDEARISGELSSSFDYVKDMVKEDAIRDAVNVWENSQKSQIQLDKMEKDIAKQMYGEKYSASNLTAVTEEFAFRRTFGYDDKNANDVKKATSNKDKVLVLKRIREELGPEEFRVWFNKGRKTVQYESGRSGYVLISDNLKDLYTQSQ